MGKKSPPGYTVTKRGNSIKFNSRNGFDLRNVPALQALGLSAPELAEGDIVTAPASCPCSAPMPWHLVAIANKRFSHVCSCRKGYAWASEKTMSYQGKRQNPIADHDEAQAARKNTKPAPDGG